MNRPEPFAAPEELGKLVVQCLGRFRSVDELGRELPIRTRKARALLAYAAISGQPTSRERLTGLLWSERGEEQARASLRQALFELRHLAPARRPLLFATRDELEIEQRHVTTDLALIRDAAAADDCASIFMLLRRADAGLLTDLDGLDPAFDDWLRSIRADEPVRTLGAVLAVAERQLERSALDVARDLVAEVQRLDPINEQGLRLAMRIDHAAGDTSALHRHFERFRTCLREEYNAEPSPETQQLFEDLVRPGAKPALGKPESDPPAAGRVVGRTARSYPAWLRPVAALVLIVGLLFAAGSQWRRPATLDGEPLVLAVLPFKAEPRDSQFIASGLWEHTRAALTRNPSMKVLGRTTTDAMVERKLTPAQYRQRLNVTHLLDGTVRQAGRDVIVSVSLTRTSDGVAIWHDIIRGRLGEPLALQDAIASGIEGKLRGRLAANGGRRAEQIVTTPEVYAMYSEARGLIAARERPGMKRAEALLREAVRRDPNYAPAWSLLGGAIYFNGRLAIDDSIRREEALAAIRRALAMAPNLAQAHATLALVEGDSAPAEASLRRAVALDPNYAEAWNWLGNSLNSQFRRQEALEAYERSLSLDPLFRSAIFNYAETAAEVGDQRRVAGLLSKVTEAGAEPAVIASVRANLLYIKRDYSAALAILAAMRKDVSGERHDALWGNWFETLTALGHYDVLHKVTGCPAWYAPMLQSKMLPPTTFEGRPVAPAEFWTSTFFSTPASRAMFNLGRHEDLVRLYRSAYRTPDDLISATAGRGLLSQIAPTLAIALEAEGAKEEARYILAAAARRLSGAMARPGNLYATSELAIVRAAQGRTPEALSLLESAIRAGWLPDGRNVTLDLANEPALRGLRGNPRFEIVRGKILTHIAGERSEAAAVKV